MTNKQPQEIPFAGLTRSLFVDYTDQQISKRNNVNDNGFNRVKYNDNVNNDNVSSKKSETEVNFIADRLVKQLNNENGRYFYYKVGWKLSEAVINRHLELALSKGKHPARYFNWLCKRDLGE